MPINFDNIQITGGLNIEGLVVPPIVGDPYWANVSLLMNNTTTNNQTNNAFLDSSTNNFTITRFGTPTQGSFNPYGTLWSVGSLNATNYLQVTNNVALSPSSGDFTIEAWVYLNSLSLTSASQSIIAKNSGTYPTGYEWILGLQENGKLVFGTYTTGLVSVSSVAGTLTINTWYHVAVTRQDTTLSIYANGQRVGTTTITGSIQTTSSAVTIGRDLETGGGGRALDGTVSNIRMVKGTALYTGATYTVPTTNLTAVSGTSLLTAQNNRPIDNSSNAFAITSSGNPEFSAFSPFSPNVAYSTSIGSSAYFDGTGDYIRVNNIFSLTADFTIEFWFYMDAISSFEMFYSTGSTDYASIKSDGNIDIGISGNYNASVATSGFKTKRWYYFTLTRQGSTVSTYLDGVRLKTASINNAHLSMGNLEIGRYTAGPEYGLSGYISGFRILKGTALYTGSSFTIPTSPLTAIANTSLLLNFTNAGIFDSAVKTNLVTVADAKVSTTQSKFAPTSVFLDGTGDYLLSTESSLAFALGSTFTIEGWVYPTSFASTPVITDVRNTNEAGYFAINTSGNLIARVGASTLTSTTALSLNTWNYVALVSTTSGSAFYINGTQRGTTATAAGFPATARRLYIGSQFDGTQLFVGYMQDLRITKGVARYTSNFTAPTQPFPTY